MDTLLACLAQAFGIGEERESGVSLDGMRMRVKSTDAAGEIGEGTQFTFHQDGSLVFARYAGGTIVDGALMGALSANGLVFVYAQCNTDNRVDMGVSHCDIRMTGDALEIVEHFQWLTRSGSGTNIFVEVP